jgi:hypothetical protein
LGLANAHLLVIRLLTYDALLLFKSLGLESATLKRRRLFAVNNLNCVTIVHLGGERPKKGTKTEGCRLITLNKHIL